VEVIIVVALGVPQILFIYLNVVYSFPILTRSRRGCMVIKDGTARQRKQRPYQIGFTLIELMVTILVMLILVAVAVPSYERTIDKARLKEAAQDIKTHWQLAREVALKRGQNVGVEIESGNAGAWCFGVGPEGCDCSQSDATASDFRDAERFLGNSMPATNIIDNATQVFEFRRGTSAAESVRMTSKLYSVEIQSSAIGNVRLCDPDPLPTDSSGNDLVGVYGACD
jgi:type IV fimbrial biogenesis protein FimT